MSNATVITKDQYLAMTPESFLKTGFRDPATGAPRPELTSVWATAGATQLAAVPPRELAATLEALRQVLPLHDRGTPEARYREACDEAAEVAARVLGAPVAEELVGWLHRYAPAVRSDRDVQDLLTHLTAVMRQHALFAGLKASDAPRAAT